MLLKGFEAWCLLLGTPSQSYLGGSMVFRHFLWSSQVFLIIVESCPQQPNETPVNTILPCSTLLLPQIPIRSQLPASRSGGRPGKHHPAFVPLPKQRPAFVSVRCLGFFHSEQLSLEFTTRFGDLLLAREKDAQFGTRRRWREAKPGIFMLHNFCTFVEPTCTREETG